MSVASIIEDMKAVFLEIYPECQLGEFESFLERAANNKDFSGNHLEMWVLEMAKVGLRATKHFVDYDVSAKVEDATNKIDSRIRCEYAAELEAARQEIKQFGFMADDDDPCVASQGGLEYA